MATLILPKLEGMALLLLVVLMGLRAAVAIERDSSLQNHQLSCTVRAAEGSYEIRQRGAPLPTLRAVVAIQIDHQWLKSSDYPRHEITRTQFTDMLGHGQAVTVKSAGLKDRPDLTYSLRLYDLLPFGDIEVEVGNATARTVTVQAIRSVEAIGGDLIELGARQNDDRVLSDSFSENRPIMRIYDLGKAPGGTHLAVGSQLVYNLKSGRSLFLGALDSRRFLTIMHLRAAEEQDGARITSYTVDSTGTTEIQSPLLSPDAPAENDRVELSMPVSPGGGLSSERLLFAVGNDYHAELEAYGATIRQLHHARVDAPNLMGWWSWSAYYGEITQGSVLTNARWLAQHMKSLGYDYLHIDSGYEYAPGEYMTANASRFPRGMRALTDEIRGLGLHVSLWTAPFFVGEHSWVYQNHKEWLVRNGHDAPIRIIAGTREPHGQDTYVLDATHPGAQQYLSQTYRTLVNEWGVRHFKFDFMDSTAIEGYYYRPNTTALEAQRIGLEIIRKAVGNDVLLDKDGSPMLNPVGIVDEGRISKDTAHTFLTSRDAATGIAARYYMHRNFFVSDPDAFNISQQMIGRRSPIKAPLTMSEAQVSIVLAALSGGTFELGDDLPTLAADPERLALATNKELLQMARLGRVSKPVDLMTYPSEDEQPSVFLLREDDRQSILAVFNWTEGSRSHSFKQRELGLSYANPQLYDVLANDRPIALEGESIVLRNGPPRSVRLIKIVDGSRKPAAPVLSTQVPSRGMMSEELRFAAAAQLSGAPVIAYHWDFGDGVSGDSPALSHAYTRAGTFKVTLEADGLDGVRTIEAFTIAVSGTMKIDAPRRETEPVSAAVN